MLPVSTSGRVTLTANWTLAPEEVDLNNGQLETLALRTSGTAEIQPHSIVLRFHNMRSPRYAYTIRIPVPSPGGDPLVAVEGTRTPLVEETPALTTASRTRRSVRNARGPVPLSQQQRLFWGEHCSNPTPGSPLAPHCLRCRLIPPEVTAPTSETLPDPRRPVPSPGTF